MLRATRVKMKRPEEPRGIASDGTKVRQEAIEGRLQNPSDVDDIRHDFGHARRGALVQVWLALVLLLTFANIQDTRQQFFVKSPNTRHHSNGQYHHGHQHARRHSLSSPEIVPSSLYNQQSARGSQSVSFVAAPTPATAMTTTSMRQQTNSELEARARSLYSSSSSLLRSGRNATTAPNSPLGSWHFPRISPEHAAEVLLTGAQVINRIAQAETPLNYCKTPDNQEGECSDIRKCIWLVLDKARLKQSVCLRNLIIPAVCCPLNSANNTPIANMIQSTLEPVLFRPKAPKQKKQPLGASLRPFASIVNKTIVSQPPPSPAALIIRNPHLSSSSTTTTTTGNPMIVINSDVASQEKPGDSLSLAASTERPAEASSQATPTTTAPSSPLALFQDDNKENHHHNSGPYNRTISHKYPWANETCGEGSRTRTGRIVGGSDSKLGQWPWMTAMYLNKRSPFSSGAGEFWCGGALINRRFILTAAHCLSDQRGNRYKNDQVTIKLGGVDLVRHQAPVDILRNLELVESRSLQPPAASQQQSAPSRHHGQQGRSDDEDEEFSWTSFITKALGLGGGSSSATTSQPSSSIPGDGTTKSINPDKRRQQLAAHAKKTYFKEYRVANIKQHPKFQRHGFYNDIGLIELKSEVDYDDLISPVCLPSEFDLKRDMSGYMATVLGWGTLSYGGQGSKLLQQVSMPIWNNKDCDDRYLQHIGKTFLCAGFLTGGKDACQGDSGGPLMVSDKSGRWTLHGVVSFGKTCAQAGYPGVYTRVTEYLDWIRDNTDLGGYAPALATTGT